MSGTRERKKVYRLDNSFAIPSKQHDIPEGKGAKIVDFPRVKEHIDSTDAEELKNLHKVLFSRRGYSIEIKRNIRKFCGFPFEKNSAAYERKKAKLAKMTRTQLRQLCFLFDLALTGPKEEQTARIMDFLMSPKASGTKLKSTGLKKSSGGTRTEKSKRKASVVKNTKKESASILDALYFEEEDEESSDEESSSESEESENDEIEQDVKQVLQGANYEEITMIKNIKMERD